MYARGHIGLTLLILSFFLKYFEITENSLTLIFFGIIFSTLPDVDLKYGFKHRNLTHNFFFALFISFIFSYALYRASNDPQLLIYSFLGSFIGVTSHIIGDLLTVMRFKPFWPLIRKEISLGLFSSENKLVNEFLFLLGLFSFFSRLVMLDNIITLS
jgi:membrane-bound metal-dependent hydrolase YbcI (DUF457 family)